MKTTSAVLLTAMAALIFAACGAPPATNTAANTNATTVKAPAAPTVDALLALEKQAHEAYLKGDGAFFQTFLSDKFAMLGMKGERHSKADSVKMIAGVKCEGAKVDLSEPQMAKIDVDTYVVTTRASYEGSCTENGKTQKLTGPVRSASIYVRQGEKWMAAWHGETMIAGEKAAPAKADAKVETKKEEPKKEDAKKPEAKPKADSSGAVDPSAADAVSGEVKPAGGPAAAKLSTDAKTAANANAPAAKPVASANTDALTKLHTAGWAAYGERDAKKLTDMTAASLSFVSPEGKWFGTKEEVIKEWTAGKCDIKSTSVADGFATALSPTVELLFTKGTANGTCDGPDGKPVKLGSLWGSAIYVKEGNDWKLAFLFESPA